MHNHLQQLLLSYLPSTKQEQYTKQLMLDFIDQHPNCLERSCGFGHFTASAWLLNRQEDKVLMMHHRKLERWLQLGGHCDGDADILAVAIKEAEEESGLSGIKPLSKQIFDIDRHRVPARKHEPAHWHFDVRFLLRYDGQDSDICGNSESKELRWCSPNLEKFPSSDQSVMRMYKKWCDRRVTA